jgi:hypothetical protein
LGKTPRKDLENNLNIPLTLEVRLHGEHICLLHLVGKKETNLNRTPKTLMSFNEQQKSMKGDKPRGRP